MIASIFALAAFAVAVVAGLAGDNATRTILTNAIVAMIVCNVVGLLIGAVLERTIDDHMKQYRAANVIPDLEVPRADRGDAPGAEAMHAQQGSG
jgi:hypothetical protein